MADTLRIPDFEFSAFYYQDILDALIRYKRQNCPEYTDESEFDPLIQALRAFALVGHLNNVNADIVGNESTLVTAQLAETVRNMLKLIDYDVRPASPAQVELVFELARTFASSITLIPQDAQVATTKVGEDDPVFFEVNEAWTISRTDQLTAAYGVDGGVFTDHTADANSPTTPADDWSPWTTPAAGDILYLGHDTVMWDQIDFTITTPMAGITGVWEYYDGNFDKTVPDTVSDIGGGELEFVLNGYLGSVNRTGTTIRVKLNETATYEDVVVFWTGSENRVRTGLLGQTIPSEDADDYTIGSDWEPLPDLVDNTNNLANDGDITFTLPQTIEERWDRTTINAAEAYWARFRIISVAGPTSPVIQQARIDLGSQYVMRLTTQGRSRSDSPLGSSTGLANQRFTTTQAGYIVNSITVEVDATAWTEVDNFLDSDPTDEHFRVEVGEDDKAIVVFGDGVNGRVPPIGVGNIVAVYKYGADVEGNVGANTVTVDKTGLTYINRVWNPRVASGWGEGDTASPEALERVKVIGPATLRAKPVAISSSDLITHTLAFVDENGARPYAHAQFFEEGFGPKTVELVVVLKGGGLATQEQLDALMLYFNGDKTAIPPVEAHFVSNQQVVAVNYVPRSVDIEGTIYGSISQEQLYNALAKVFRPEARRANGVDFEWQFGELIPLSRINHEIHDIDESITRVVLTTPAADIELTNRELPVLRDVNVTIIDE